MNTEREIEIEILKTKLKETDYMTLKYVEGVLPENEWIVIKTQREEWRKEIERLEKMV